MYAWALLAKSPNWASHMASTRPCGGTSLQGEQIGTNETSEHAPTLGLLCAAYLLGPACPMICCASLA